jgi:hypothetical protein
MKKILIIFLCILALNSYSQTVRLTYEAGYGFYDMKNIRKFQLDAIKQLNGMPVQALEKFPGYLNHSANLAFYLDKNNLVGFNASYLTTGGRNHLSDYSGEYKLDMILNGYQFGIESEHIFNLNKKFDLNANFKTGLIISRLDITEYLIIYGLDSDTSSSDYTQPSFFIEPNLNTSYHFNKSVLFNLGVGLNLNTSAFYGAIIDWSGLRTRVGVSYIL